MQKTKPDDWEHNYNRYFECNESGGYTSAKPSTSITNSKIVGIKNSPTKRTFTKQYDITGYVDKDVENTLFKYRRID
jgi:hypothetical protein